MAKIENTEEGPRGFFVDQREYLVPPRGVIGSKVVNGSLDIDDAALAKARKEPGINALFECGTLVEAKGSAKADPAGSDGDGKKK